MTGLCTTYTFCSGVMKFLVRGFESSHQGNKYFFICQIRWISQKLCSVSDITAVQNLAKIDLVHSALS